MLYGLADDGSSANRVVAYEKHGLNSKRLVAMSSGVVVEVDQEAFAKLNLTERM